jgi:hypothetical protein
MKRVIMFAGLACLLFQGGCICPNSLVLGLTLLQSLTGQAAAQ